MSRRIAATHARNKAGADHTSDDATSEALQMALKAIFRHRTVEMYYIPFQFSRDSIPTEESVGQWSAAVPPTLQSASFWETSIITCQCHTYSIIPEEPVTYSPPVWLDASFAQGPHNEYLALLPALAGDGGMGSDVVINRMPSSGRIEFRLVKDKGNVLNGHPEVLVEAGVLRDIYIVLRFRVEPLIL